MIGAIVGDVVGSRFEFDNIKTKDFELITEESRFTDDTVLTIAVMDWLLHACAKSSKTAEEYIRKWADKYPNIGYGGMFRRWKNMVYTKPYHSFGNGAAMRISGIGWVGKDIDEVKHLSDIMTGITHNHPEGLKGAFVVAELINMARKCVSKQEMKMFAEQFYDIGFKYEDLVENYSFNSTCQRSIPQALFCFFRSDSFEDCLRTTISIGGDCDTTAAISCSIAEAFYDHIPSKLIEEVRKKLTPEMLKVVDEFKEKYGGY